MKSTSPSEWEFILLIYPIRTTVGRQNQKKKENWGKSSIIFRRQGEPSELVRLTSGFLIPTKCVKWSVGEGEPDKKTKTTHHVNGKSVRPLHQGNPRVCDSVSRHCSDGDV